MEGGRRCPCNSGSRRRAYQRARYAMKVALAERPSFPPSRTGATTPGWRDPAETRTAAMKALTALRACDVPSSSWLGTPELERYVAAVTDHGNVLRNNLTAEVDRAWLDAGVTDDQLAGLVQRKREIGAEMVARRKEATRILEETEAFKTAHPGWLHDPQLKERVSEMGTAWATLSDSAELTAQSYECSTKLLKANGVRQRLFAEQVRKTLEQERELGGSVRLAPKTRMSKADRAMMEQCLGLFPTEMIAFAEAQGGGGLRMVRSKRRAHYVFRRSSKVKISHASVLNARSAVLGRPTWHRDFSYARNPEKAFVDGDIDWDVTVEDTPENRSLLQRAVDEYNDGLPSSTPARKHARIHTVSAPAWQSQDDARLAVIVDEAYYRYGWDGSDQAGELTFNDPASMTHEFGHHMEARNPEVSAACRSFLKRRTEGLPRERYGDTTSRKKVEVVTPDGFVDRYIGKHYDDAHHTEVFSMGVEALGTGAHGGLLGITVNTGTLAQGVVADKPSDPEHFNLVMGLLALANKAP